MSKALKSWNLWDPFFRIFNRFEYNIIFIKYELTIKMKLYFLINAFLLKRKEKQISLYTTYLLTGPFVVMVI